MKIIRCDRELETPHIDRTLRDWGHELILMPHLTFYTKEAMDRLEAETLERCKEIIEGRPVTIRSNDPRLQGGPV